MNRCLLCCLSFGATLTVASPSVAATYLFDGAGRLARLEDGAKVVTYAYEGDGMLTKRCVSQSGGPPACTEIVTADGVVVGEVGTSTVLHAYVDADLVASKATDAAPSYVADDHLGSTRARVGSDGTVLARSGTSAYGEPRLAGASERYAGHYAADGLVWMRARWYDPASGRFLGRDDVAGTASRPASLNRYSYVENSPMGLVDPSGNSPELHDLGPGPTSPVPAPQGYFARPSAQATTGTNVTIYKAPLYGNGSMQFWHEFAVVSENGKPVWAGGASTYSGPIVIENELSAGGRIGSNGGLTPRAKAEGFVPYWSRDIDPSRVGSVTDSIKSTARGMQGKPYYIPGWSEASGYYSPYSKGIGEIKEAGVGRNCFGLACGAREAALRNLPPPPPARIPWGALGRGTVLLLTVLGSISDAGDLVRNWDCKSPVDRWSKGFDIFLPWIPGGAIMHSSGRAATGAYLQQKAQSGGVPMNVLVY